MLTLFPLNREDLPVGKPLPGNVYDVDEKVLFPTGHPLQPEECAALPECVRVDDGWSARPLPEDAANKLFQRVGAGTPVSNERQHERRAWRHELTVTLVRMEGRRVSAREVHVITADISTHGMSFIFGQYVQPGTMVRAVFDALPHHPTVAGVVRSCQLREGMSHQVGVQFVETP